MIPITALLLLALAGARQGAHADDARNGLLVLQTDFGERDGAVAAMRGVAYSVSPNLLVSDLTHQITPFNTWEAGYRLMQTAPFWPRGSVFVSVVDPGVGTARRSIVARAGDKYFVTPDNGTLTLLADGGGIDAVREIDERTNRRPGSDQSHTFHGRDVYTYTGARLASGKISFEEVGPELEPETLVLHDVPLVSVTKGSVNGFIPVLDPRYGNVWTNVDRAAMAEAGLNDASDLDVTITEKGKTRWRGIVPLAKTFGDVAFGEPLAYYNSLEKIAIALNQGDFAGTNNIEAGPEWRIELGVVEQSFRPVD